MITTKEEFAKQIKRAQRATNKGSKHYWEKVHLAGRAGDIESWNGYSYDPYTIIRFELDEAGNIVDLWSSQETGNFLPMDPYYVIRTRYSTQEDIISHLWETYNLQ